MMRVVVTPEQARDRVRAQVASDADTFPIPATVGGALSGAKVIAVVGSRKFPDLDRVNRLLEQLPPYRMIISGQAQGVDQRAAEVAVKQLHSVVGFLPDSRQDYDHWTKAAIARDGWFSLVADVVVAFWDGMSPGTMTTIREALKRGRCIVALPGHPAELWVPRI